MNKEKEKKTSQLIEQLVESCEGEDSITVEAFFEKMGHRALAIGLLVLAILALVAGAVPGFSTLTGIPIILVSIQMMLGKKHILLPHQIKEKHISPTTIRGSLTRAIPVLRAIEKFLRPRLLFLTNKYAERLIALVIFVLAAVLSLPIPGGNFLPSLGICFLALAMLERDGIFRR
jgi:hypothetical protein